MLIVDDQASQRRALTHFLNAVEDLSVVGTASSGPEAVALGRELRPDVVLMDIRMPDGDGISAASLLAAEDPAIPSVLMTAFDTSESLFDALDAGAAGYVLKLSDRNEMLLALRAAARGNMLIAPAVTRRLISRRRPRLVDGGRAGDAALTAREREIVRALCAGSSTNEALAERLGLSVLTIKSHLSRIMPKAGVESRAQLVAWAFRAGVVE